MTENNDLPGPEDAPSKCREFVPGFPEHMDEDNADDFPFSFVCPRCGTMNALQGNPHGFKNKPFRCIDCNYVPLLPAEELEAFASEHYDSAPEVQQ